MLLFTLIPKIFSLSCSDLPEWQMNCTRGTPDPNSNTFIINCPKTGKFTYKCQVYEGISCEGSREVEKTLNCIPTNGKSAGTALCLSIFLGFFGADRFYLGYPTIGVFKLLTAGFFGLGWYLDIFLIALRIVQPAGGNSYAFSQGGNFLVRLPNKLYY